MFTTIISAGALATHLHDPDWAIFDCRFDLMNPDWGYEDYQKAHIPGAVYAHLDRDLAGPKGPETGRHPLPAVETMAHQLGAWGIKAGTQVVVYDTTGGAYAVRLWWLLRFLGHPTCAVLDGGFQGWQQAGYPTGSGVETRAPAHFEPKPDWSLVVSADDVERIRQDANYRLIDARAPERYRGEKEPIDPIAGHIPGALNRFHGANLGPEGVFLPPERLRDQFGSILEGVSPENVVVYCGSGITSIHHILAMELAGLPGAKLYPGSWSEWITDKKRRISKI